MAEEPKNTNDVKKKEDLSKVQDFGMYDEGGEAAGVIVPQSRSEDAEGGRAEAPQPNVAKPSEVDISAQPKINRYSRSEAEATSPKVNQTAEAANSAVNPKGPVPPAATGTPTPPTRPKTGLPNPEARRKALLGCLGAFGSILIIFLVLSFVFLAQADKGPNPIAKLLGVNQGAFINGLITFIHIIFILIALTTFVFTMVGLFKASMAKKGDKETRKSGLRMSLTSGIVLLLVLIIWGIVFAYLDAKRVQLGPEITDPIVTTPEETLGLSAPIEIRFDGSNITFDKGKYKIASHEWDFGDESTGTGQIVTHTYEEKGTFTVKLTVKVEEKDTGEILELGTFTKNVTITDEALAAIFSADPQSGEAPLEVKLDASESKDPDGKIDRYEWDFDEDGEFDDAEGIEAKKTFEKIGKYTISLRVTNSIGEFNISEKEIDVVKAEEPEPKITVVDEPKEYLVGVNYVFKADESTSPNGKIEKYEWDFGDGSEKEETKSASHTFNQQGTYEIKLKVTDEEDKEAEVTLKITVGAAKGAPKPVINTDPVFAEGDLALTGKVPFTVIFDAKQTTDNDNNVIDYAWDFGDGTENGVGETATHTFNSEGTFTVILTVTDADDNEGKATIGVKVEQQGIVTDLKADKVEGNVPLTVNFDATGSTYNEGQITSYKWDFGDNSGSKLGASTISHKYTSIGTFPATVTIIGSDNSTATATVNITVREIPLQACFTSVFEKGPAPLETSFDSSCSSGTIKNYFWDFGDGETSTSAKPTHVFEKAGNYTVRLEVSDAGNTVSKAEVEINVTE